MSIGGLEAWGVGSGVLCFVGYWTTSLACVQERLVAATPRLRHPDSRQTLPHASWGQDPSLLRTTDLNFRRLLP